MREEVKVPKSFSSPAFLDHCEAVYRGSLPLHQWLVKLAGG